MNFEYPQKTLDLIEKVDQFIKKYLFPHEQKVYEFSKNNLWENYPEMENWKEMAKEQGLWNLFLPKVYGDLSPGLSNLEYAPLAEKMGSLSFASEVFNCSPPDTGNMETIAKYGTENQKEQWLKPIMNGEIRSAFLMTEPAVASSDATNIQTSIARDGDHYVINGRKWWSSGAMNPNCKVYILMGKTDFSAQKHAQQSMIIVPANTPGVKILRPMQVFGSVDSPEGHAEIELKDVRVPVSNILLGEGRGFEIAQGRLGPGRIHHCMRLIGAAQRSLDLMCKRTNQRTAFGRNLIKFSSIRQEIAKSECEVQQARLLTLAAADKIDKFGAKEAKNLIAMIKITVPQMACDVIDRAIQIHGGMGVSQDTPLAGFYVYARCIRLADGPDEVHMFQLGKNLAKEHEV
ncbi:MAG: acyl-CoA dehydrogenase [Flavobacteriaceae bacterium]|jgi:acyl-CoA dehydrogenase|nr:acyl-CoA dehydrogenase [Flavobacteriaceae bacterium]MBT3754114.1 acyl-CoA dehydrogenase [Flavobacteriaceae bacterium]MBT3794221.1 acyl-CoA dehydrogenase [Flavobacteriaceae bacterium]MBT4063039.1 acyl-CoA dehydrogenase [Flavobacteriaceae bacterium]MBT4246754.1 acyl-CoA dehydrogenase [Flavobacteriaceae bacterium]